jgi:hypothetical protein
MRITRILFVGSCVAGLAAACGGSKTTGGGTDDGGGLNSSSGSGSSSGGSGSGSSSGASSGGDDAATLFDTGIPGVMQSCASSQDCTGGDVCCTGFGMGAVTIACAATCTGMGAIQLCASSDECTGGATCVASPFGMDMFCQAPRGDGGMFPRRDGGGRPMDDGGRPADDGGTPADTGAE